MTTTTLYRPPDVEAAWEQWKAACGPCAAAAILGRSLAAVRPLFPGHADRGGYANPTHLEAALTKTGARFRKDSQPVGLPVFGLAFLQITGPWDAPGVSPIAAYKHTHWVAASMFNDEADDLIYDMNAAQENGVRGDWWPRQWWERDVMAAIVAAHKRATGWRVRVAYEVTLP